MCGKLSFQRVKFLLLFFTNTINITLRGFWEIKSAFRELFCIHRDKGLFQKNISLDPANWYSLLRYSFRWAYLIQAFPIISPSLVRNIYVRIEIFIKIKSQIFKLCFIAIEVSLFIHFMINIYVFMDVFDILKRPPIVSLLLEEKINYLF